MGDVVWKVEGSGGGGGDGGGWGVDCMFPVSDRLKWV